MNNKQIKTRRRVRALSAVLLAAASFVPVQAGTFNNNFGTDPSLDGSVIFEGSAKWVGTGGGAGYVSITDQVNSLQGGMTVPDLDAGEAVGGFTVTFKLQIGPGSGNAADGFSFNWGTDVPTNPSEEGGGTGITVAFDIYDNGGGEAPSIDLKVGGATIAQKAMTKAEIMTTGFADVKIEYKAGLISVDYKGQSVFAAVPALLPPQTGAFFTFGARTGGENAAQWIDDLNITTVPPTTPTITGIRSSAKGVSVSLQDGIDAAVDPATVTATIDGSAVTGAAVKNADTTVYTFNNPGIYTAGSIHDMVLSYSYGTPATATTTAFSFTVAPYTTLPASAALTVAVDPAKRGFEWRVHQVDSTTDLPNTHGRTESQLGGLLGDNVADPAAQGGADAPSTAPVPTTAPILFTVSTVINFSDPTAGGEAGRFTPDADFPGIPGVTGDDDNIAGEVMTAVEFPAPGLYRLVVNSDDGFRTTAGRNPRDPSNVVLGQFEGGRGPADSPFDVLIEAAGFYPMRTIWEEGGGGAALEMFSQLLDGTRLLLNDTAGDARALKTYQIPASAVPAYLSSTTPASGTLVRPDTIGATLVDAGTTVTDGSVSVKVNGVTVPSTATRTGGETKVVISPPGGLAGNTVYTVDLTYSDNTGPHTVTWTFTSAPLSSTLFVIEAEDFDYSDDGGVTGGLHNPQIGVEGMDVDVMPYYGGAYEGLSAALNVDYFGDDPGDGAVYRTEDRYFGDPGPNPDLPRTEFNDVSMYADNGNPGGNGLGGNIPIASNERGTYQTTSNYGLGWSGGDWYNYTREFPTTGTGWWEVYIGLSHGESLPGQLSATLSRVTSGVGTTTQTLEPLGSFNGPGSGTWGRDNLVPMRNASGGMAVVKLQGLQTVRATISSGDYDFLIFTAANPPPPSIAVAPQDDAKRDEAMFDWVIQDGGSLIDVSTVRVMLNGQDVTSQATSTKTATGATIHLDLTGTLLDAGELPWTITFNDNSATPQTVTSSGIVVINPYPTPGIFVIEAEDFNYSEDDVTGGKTNPQAGTPDLDVNVMPYLGGAYDTLSAIPGVDFNGNDGQESDVYRTEKDPAPAIEGEVNMVNITVANGPRFSNDRGTFTTTSNYRIGWVGGSEWANYTRTFPANDYKVWAALSYDGRGAGLMRGSLDLVTSDPTLPNQTVQPLGDFNSAASGGWGRNELVPMKSNGAIATVSLGGLQTVRFNMPSGDFDYLVFVPTTTTPTGPEFTSVVRNANGTITFVWTGEGVLETATSILGGWTDVQGASGGTFTYTPPAGEQMRFWRIRAPQQP